MPDPQPGPTNAPSQGYAAIWAAFRAWAPFVAMFRAGDNTQVDESKKGFTPPVQAQIGDRASAWLRQGKYVFHQQRNSKTVELIVDYPLQVAGGQLNVNVIGLANTVVIQALKNAKTNLGLGIIYKWDAVSGNTQKRDPQTKRPEYTTLMTIRVWFWIPNAEFQNTVYT